MSAAVVKVTTVGFTLSVYRSQGVWCRTDPPVMTRLREAGEEGMLDTFVVPGAGGVVCLSGWKSLLEDAGSTATPHLEDRRVLESSFSVSED